MTSTEFDPAAYKEGQRAGWNAGSRTWQAWSGAFERGAATLTARLLELGGVRAGQRVLDVATGQGEPALSAARVVGPGGQVVGVDISPDMLAVARERAAGLSNVEFVEADLETLGLPAASFDVVLSRFGLMFAVDHVASFRVLARVLVPGGVLAAAVWGPPATARLFLGPATLAELLDRPPLPTGAPSAFSMSDPGRLEAEVAAAGFAEVSVTEELVPFWFDSVEEYLTHTREMLQPAVQESIRERFGSLEAAELWQEVAAALQPHVEEDGRLRLPSVTFCLRAVKPR